MKDNEGPEPSPGRPAEAVVALGASAGGLKALDTFFAAVSPDLPAAFVVIQHLAPDHKSMMDTLLGRHTTMPVKVAAEGDRLCAGHVYVIPEGMTMTLHDRRLHLVPRPKQGVMHPINAFFHSMVQSGFDQMFAVVLSGTGADGAEGLKTVAEAGGWVLVQSPASATFDGMPLNALATRLAQREDTPDALAGFIEDVLREGRRPTLLKVADTDSETLEDTIARISAAIGIDLTCYKTQTLVRRLERRLLATGLSDPVAYLQRLNQSEDEQQQLRREVMIPVTSFFRDGEAFDDLSEKVLRPALEAQAQASHPGVRIWSVGCSTGQEAYSLGIMALEMMRETGVDAELKIFATDIEKSYLKTAIAGVYPTRMVQHMPREVRERYFQPFDDANMQVTSRLRRAILFSEHDVLNDPPFLHLDLVVCRNMLIYLQPEPRDRAMRRMMFGLAPGGALFLGSAEAPGKLGNLLDTVSARSKIYRMRSQLRHLSREDVLATAARRKQMAARDTAAPPSTAKGTPEPAPLSDAMSALSSAAACLLRSYAPASVVVDSNREIRRVFGDVFPYLKLREGYVSLDLMQLLPERTAALVSTMLHATLRDKSQTKSVDLHPADDPDMSLSGPVRIQFRPVLQPGEADPRQVIISFAPLDPERMLGARKSEAAPAAGRPLQKTEDATGNLASELERVRATLRTTIDELATANAELQTRNEELQASNEELQGTNEELRSVNEELHTVNQELQQKIVQLNEAYADLEGLSRAARIPMVFLDGAGRVTRFSSQATEIFRLREQDIGRPLMDINHALDMPDLEERINEALDAQQMIQKEVSGRNGRSWLVTLQPFVTHVREESRLVLSFIDISSIKAMRYLQSVIDAAPQNMAVLDPGGELRMVNAAWRDFATENGGTKRLANGYDMNYLDVLRGAAKNDSDARTALEGLEETLAKRRQSFSFVYPCHSDTKKRWFMMHAAPLRDGGCVVTHLDITNLNLPQSEESST